MNTSPLEIVGSPLTLYLAPIGTDFPGLDDDEGDFDADWFKVGTSGHRNYSEEGVTVGHEQTLNYFRGAGSTLARKAFRTEEDFLISVNLADVSAEQYAKNINDAEVTTVAAGASQHGEKSFSLVRGLAVATFALLARGVSPEHETGPAQYEVDSVVADGSSSLTFTKGEPAILVGEFRAIDAAGTGEGIEHRIYTDDPTS